MGNYYLLNNDGTVTPTDDLLLAANQFEYPEDRIIARTFLFGPLGTMVSTIFLVFDHQWSKGPPILFETMIFGYPVGKDDEYQERYSTIEEARAGHERAVRWAKAEALKWHNIRALVVRILKRELPELWNFAREEAKVSTRKDTIGTRVEVLKLRVAERLRGVHLAMMSKPWYVELNTKYTLWKIDRRSRKHNRQ